MSRLSGYGSFILRCLSLFVSVESRFVLGCTVAGLVVRSSESSLVFCGSLNKIWIIIILFMIRVHRRFSVNGLVIIVILHLSVQHFMLLSLAMVRLTLLEHLAIAINTLFVEADAVVALNCLLHIVEVAMGTLRWSMSLIGHHREIMLHLVSHIILHISDLFKVSGHVSLHASLEVEEVRLEEGGLRLRSM